MRRPILYYVRHGETDWNAEHACKGSTTRRSIAVGRGAGAALRRNSAQLLFARERRSPADLDYVSSPLSRARVAMELMRNGARARSPGLSHRPAADRNVVRRLGRARPSLHLQAQRSRSAGAARAGQLAVSCRRAAKATRSSLPRSAIGTQRSRATRWSQRICAPPARCWSHLGLEPQTTALARPIEQGVVYVFDHNGMTRHGA